MKKKKPPIILGALMATLLGGVFIFGAMNSQPPKNDGGHNHGDDKVTGESTTAPSASDLHEHTVAKKGGRSKMGPEEDNPSEGEPSILEPDYVEYRPTPSDSATSARWYDDESQHSRGN